MSLQAARSLPLLSLRRSYRFRPISIPRNSAPTFLRRPITIQAPGPNSFSSDSDGSSGRFEIVPDQGSTLSANPSSSTSSTTGGSSQHPYATADAPPNPEAGPSSNPTNLPAPPEPVPVFRPHHLVHPFDTHAFVTYLEKSDIPLGRSKVLMEAVRRMIVTRGEKTREELVGKEEMENEAYLFRAALSELRTELSVRARNDGLVLRTMTGAIRREVEGLEQKLKEDVATLKHDIEMDMNNRKSETRTEMKGFEIAIEEINNKFTISLGDLRTEIESAKWDATRRAISIIIVIVVAAIALSSYSTAAAKAALPPVKPAMKDTAIMTDEPLMEDDVDDVSSTEGELERLLRNSGLDVKERGKMVDQASGGPSEVGAGVRTRRKGKKEIDVDRI